MDRIARGGPTMLRPKDWNVFLKITTDTSEKLYADFSTIVQMHLENIT